MQHGPIVVTPNQMPSVLQDAADQSNGYGGHSVPDQEAELWQQSLIGGFWGELTRAIARRRSIERKARIVRAHYHCQYPDGLQTDDPEDSELFFPRTREVVAYGVARVLQMISPPHEDVWDLTTPQNQYVGPRSNEGQQPNGDPGSDQAKQAEQMVDQLKLSLRDQLEKMDWEGMKSDLAFDLGLYGTSFFFGPVKADDPRLIWDSESGSWSKDTDETSSWRAEYVKLRFWDVFLDPECINNNLSDCEFFFVKRLMTKHQLRQLARDPSFDKDAIEEVLEDVADAFVGAGPAAMSYEIYDPHSDSIVTAIGRTFQDRYAIWMRVGVLGREEIAKLPPELTKGFEKDENGRAKLTEGGIYECWFCGDKIIRFKAREFQPDKMPLIVVPLERMDGSPYGRGWAEMMMCVQESENSLVRFLQDGLRHASGYQAVVDMRQIAVGTDLSIRGRKVWATRSVEDAKSKPVEFQIIPTNQKDLIGAMEFWEKMVPVVSSLPRMQPQDMGSGVRTDGMLETQLAQLEMFIKLVIGNIDRYFIEPVVKDLVLWNRVYNTTDDCAQTPCKVFATGVLGAIKREIVGRKAAALMKELQGTDMADAIDDFEMLRMRTQGLGMDGTRLVLSPQALVAKRAAAAQQKRMEAMAEAQGTDEGQDRVRAETSVRDALVAMASNIQDPNNPVWAPAMFKVYQSVGEVDPMIASALAVWSKKIAMDYARIGAANDPEVQNLSGGFQTANPAEVEPGPYRQQAMQGHPVGDVNSTQGFNPNLAPQGAQQPPQVGIPPVTPAGNPSV